MTTDGVRPYRPLFILGPNKVAQLGSHNECARVDCKAKSTSWRVLLGQWDVQVLVCTNHLSWACQLDLLSEKRGKSHGWTPVPVIDGCQSMRITEVVAEMPMIQRTDFGREVPFRAAFPQTVVTDDGELMHVWSTASTQ